PDGEGAPRARGRDARASRLPRARDGVLVRGAAPRSERADPRLVLAPRRTLAPRAGFGRAVRGRGPRARPPHAEDARRRSLLPGPLGRERPRRPRGRVLPALPRGPEPRAPRAEGGRVSPAARPLAAGLEPTRGPRAPSRELLRSRSRARGRSGRPDRLPE